MARSKKSEGDKELGYTKSRANRFAKMATEEPLVVMVDADVFACVYNLGVS